MRWAKGGLTDSAGDDDAAPEGRETATKHTKAKREEERNSGRGRQPAPSRTQRLCLIAGTD